MADRRSEINPMAKKKRTGPNKSAAIKAYKEANPEAKPKQIAEALQADGVDVNAQYVSTILSQARAKSGQTKKRSGKKTAKKAGRGGTRGPRAVASGGGRASGGDISVQSLMKVKELVSEVGSVDEVRTALSAYERLTER